MAQLGYENVQAAGVEKTVVSPKIQQNILGVDYPVSVFAKAFQYFRLPVREFHFRSGMWRCTGSYIRQALCDGVESIIAYFETGGGPFLAYNSDGTISLQILESSQIDMNNAAAKEMFEKGTHFNPVDLVCAVRDYKGHKFDLVNYVDKATGFISYKSKNGKDLKALELPGLWNGAMSDWNTVFVEVPLSTFNPVKTVNDLLREQHQ